MTHLHVMWRLEESGELPMSRLAEFLDVSLSNATGLIDRMEERGLVERSRVSDDRRVVLVRLTAGRAQDVLDEIQIMKDDLHERRPRPARRAASSTGSHAGLRDFRACDPGRGDRHTRISSGRIMTTTNEQRPEPEPSRSPRPIEGSTQLR